MNKLQHSLASQSIKQVPGSYYSSLFNLGSITACISCGQCTSVCPVGALIEKPHIHYVQRGLKNKHGKIYVAHTAPAVRVAISEEFGMAPGSISTGKLVSALKVRFSLNALTYS